MTCTQIVSMRIVTLLLLNLLQNIVTPFDSTHRLFIEPTCDNEYRMILSDNFFLCRFADAKHEAYKKHFTPNKLIQLGLQQDNLLAFIMFVLYS